MLGAANADGVLSGLLGLARTLGFMSSLFACDIGPEGIGGSFAGEMAATFMVTFLVAGADKAMLMEWDGRRPFRFWSGR
jgi:hypothetical protein